ncbi:hypothetical protein EVAR_78540_1 [Eumeta japonica]|uniref:Mos1 transposase HTH domain-containing protein n=1 Tax=Eumeta variegata TaxID=151549 RepID=A0A4C1W7I1_EUMVA|nr:hypothetical protein EVAR_78540_1 [Eumeta japonica]
MILTRENFLAMILYDFRYHLSQQESYNRLQLAFHDEAPSLAAVYNRSNLFEQGRIDPPEGRPSYGDDQRQHQSRMNSGVTPKWVAPYGPPPPPSFNYVTVCLSVTSRGAGRSASLPARAPVTRGAPASRKSTSAHYGFAASAAVSISADVSEAARVPTLRPAAFLSTLMFMDGRPRPARGRRPPIGHSE